MAAESRPRLLAAGSAPRKLRGGGDAAPRSPSASCLPELAGRGLLSARLTVGSLSHPQLGFSLKSLRGGERNEGGDGGELGYTTSVLASAPSLASSLETTTSPLFTSPLISPALFHVGREMRVCV